MAAVVGIEPTLSESKSDALTIWLRRYMSVLFPGNTQPVLLLLGVTYKYPS